MNEQAMNVAVFLKRLLAGQAILLLLALTGAAQNAPRIAKQTVEEFYQLHFHEADKMYFTPENIGLRQPWLTPKLYQLMQREFQRAAEHAKTHPDDKPFFVGDVFTDGEDLPQKFQVTAAQETARTALVTVWLYWDDNTVGKMKRRVRVRLLKQSQRWLIDNLLYDQGEDLVKLLNRPNYQ